MIEFYDVSVWQNPADVSRLVRLNKDKVLAVKASEGANIKDKKAVMHVDAVKDVIETFIFYHFMRCDKNAGAIAVEVKNFMDAVKNIANKTGIKKCIYALDFERCDNTRKYSDYANPAHREALTNAINLLTMANGVAPYVYACESEYKGLMKHGVYIPWAWVAKYSKFPPVEPWGIWQYTNTHGKIDRNKYRAELSNLQAKAVEI